MNVGGIISGLPLRVCREIATYPLEIAVRIRCIPGAGATPVAVCARRDADPAAKGCGKRTRAVVTALESDLCNWRIAPRQVDLGSLHPQARKTLDGCLPVSAF